MSLGVEIKTLPGMKGPEVGGPVFVGNRLCFVVADDEGNRFAKSYPYRPIGRPLEDRVARLKGLRMAGKRKHWADIGIVLGQLERLEKKA